LIVQHDAIRRPSRHASSRQRWADATRMVARRPFWDWGC
jgi:hypothetical protein